MKNIIIDEEFKSLLPALDEKTYEMLEENLIENGCRDALILWNGVLIDGHNRYEICTKHDIPFNTTDKEFASREDALIWIITTQVARRNLTPIQLSYFRGLHYRADKIILTNAKGKNQHSEVVGQNDQQPPNQFTAQRLSRQYRVSPKTITRDAKVANAIDAIGETSPETKRKILAGEAVLNKRDLQGLSSLPKEEIEAVAASIEDGTYEKTKADAPAQVGEGDAGSAGPADDDAAESIDKSDGEGLRLLADADAAIGRIATDFQTVKMKLAQNGDKTELKSALEIYIGLLTDIYGRI